MGPCRYVIPNDKRLSNNETNENMKHALYTKMFKSTRTEITTRLCKCPVSDTEVVYMSIDKYLLFLSIFLYFLHWIT